MLPWVLAASGLVGVAAIVGIGLLFWVLVPYLRGGEDVASSETSATTVALPDVVGMSREEAERSLRAEGLEVEAQTLESSREEEGAVLEQSPSGGEEAEESSTVEITVGQGPPRPASGYTLVEHDSGNLSVEVPSGWSGKTDKNGTFTGEDSEAGGGFGPALTVSSDLDAFENVYDSGVPGGYMVASRELARGYTEDDLVDSGFNDRSDCEATDRRDFNRSTYSGRMQTWNCVQTGSTFYTLAAAPKGRQCVVMLQVSTYSEADRKAAQHIMDTFEVDCGGIS